MTKKKKEETTSQELEELQGQYQRVLADYANFKRRTEEQAGASYQNGVNDVLGELVKILDDFSLALNNSNDLESFKKGMEMIFANIMSSGEEFGLEKIKTLGEKFDPTKHEALLAQESEEEAQTILEELQSGFMVKGKVIRTAKVKVAR
jgi:molecular chaperone GrpE